MATPHATCQCGLHAIPLPLPEPIRLYHCHCSECRRQSASAFGTSALYPADSFQTYMSSAIDTTDVLGSETQAASKDDGVPVQKPRLAFWSRPTLRGHTMDCFFCMRCGSRLFHHIRGRETVSIKAGTIEPAQSLDWNAAVHIWVQNAVTSIPEGAKRWDAEPDD